MHRASRWRGSPARPCPTRAESGSAVSGMHPDTVKLHGLPKEKYATAVAAPDRHLDLSLGVCRGAGTGHVRLAGQDGGLLVEAVVAWAVSGGAGYPVRSRRRQREASPVRLSSGGVASTTKHR